MIKKGEGDRTEKSTFDNIHLADFMSSDKNLEMEEPEEEKDDVSDCSKFSADLPETLSVAETREPQDGLLHETAAIQEPEEYQSNTTASDNRNPKLLPEDLVGGLRLILLEGGLFYPGTLEVLDQDALLYGVLVDGQRVSRPHVLCQEELLESAMKEISLKDPVVGSRVCAFWSGQLQALYPGTLTECNPTSRNKSGEQIVTISFDDGDSGQIPINDVRILPPTFPFTKVESPVLPSFITRKRQSRTGTGDVGCEAKVLKRSSLSKKNIKLGQNSNEQEPLIKCWQWEGNCEMDGSRVTTHQAIKKGDTIVKVGDLVQLRSDARFGGSRSPTTGNNVYVGFVRKLWETKTKVKKVRVAWCYRSNEVEQSAAVKKLQWQKRAVFISSHTDDNSVETISCRCELLPWKDFLKMQKEAGCQQMDLEQEPFLYYLAGSYDPVNKRVKMEPDLQIRH